MVVEVISTTKYKINYDEYIADCGEWLFGNEGEITEKDKENLVRETIDEYYGPFEIAKNPSIFTEIGDDTTVECY